MESEVQEIKKCANCQREKEVSTAIVYSVIPVKDFFCDDCITDISRKGLTIEIL